MDTKKKVAVAIIGIELVGGFVGSMWCFARSQYYRGRVDAANELSSELRKLKNGLEEKVGLPEKES